MHTFLVICFVIQHIEISFYVCEWNDTDVIIVNGCVVFRCNEEIIISLLSLILMSTWSVVFVQPEKQKW